jgi:hypothetical protein
MRIAPGHKKWKMGVQKSTHQKWAHLECVGHFLDFSSIFSPGDGVSSLSVTRINFFPAWVRPNSFFKFNSVKPLWHYREGIEKVSRNT